MRAGKPFLIAAVMPTLDASLYGRMTRVFQEHLKRLGHLVVFATAGFDNFLAAEEGRRLVDRGVDALVFVGQIEDAEFAKDLKSRRIPAVSTFTFADDSPLPTIGYDNAEAIRQVMNHALSLGHRDFCFLCGPLRGNDRQKTRVATFNAVLAERGLDGRVFECEFTMSRGIDATRAILREEPQTTAIICSSDILAFGAISECRRAGRRVPDDMTIIGFGDHEFLSGLEPALTTIAEPHRAMGERCAEALIKALETRSEPRSILLPTNLILRRSSAAVRVKQLASS